MTKKMYFTIFVTCFAFSSLGFSVGKVAKMCEEYGKVDPNTRKETNEKENIKKKLETYCEQKFKDYTNEDNVEKAQKYKFMKHFGLEKIYCLPRRDNPLLQTTLLQYKQAKKMDGGIRGFSSR